MPISNISPVTLKIVPDDKLPEGLLDFPTQFSEGINGQVTFTNGQPPVSFYNLGQGAQLNGSVLYATFQPQYSTAQTQLTQIRCVELSMTFDPSQQVFIYCQGNAKMVILNLPPLSQLTNDDALAITVNACIELNAPPNSPIYLIFVRMGTAFTPPFSGFINFTNYKKNQYFHAGPSVTLPT